MASDSIYVCLRPRGARRPGTVECLYGLVRAATAEAVVAAQTVVDHGPDFEDACDHVLDVINRSIAMGEGMARFNEDPPAPEEPAPAPDGEGDGEDDGEEKDE